MWMFHTKYIFSLFPIRKPPLTKISLFPHPSHFNHAVQEPVFIVGTHKYN